MPDYPFCMTSYGFSKGALMEFLAQLNAGISSIVWGAPTLLLMLFTGGYFTFRTGFFQIRHFGHCLKNTVFAALGNKKRDGESISQFSAMCSALAATLGTGNIAGVSTALAAGGAGAVFWMWVSAVFGMMTGYAENVLGIYYRRRINGVWRGGAMCYIKKGLSEKKSTKPLAKPLSVLFAGLCVLAGFGMGNMAQMNAAAEALKVNFGVAPLITGIIAAIVAAPVMLGGVHRTAGFTGKIVPFMSGFYIIGSVYILISNAARLPDMFAAIFEGALGLRQIGGGIAGYTVKKAVSMGFRRGVFSNEAGLGTSVAAHASSDVIEPVIGGMWSIFEVFFDTIVMCSLTAFVLLSSPCSAPPMNEALNNITTETAYFRLCDDDSIITSGRALPIVGSGSEISCRTAYGGSFSIPISEGEIIYTNVMTVRGIQASNPDGSLLWLDKEETRPLIKTAEITPVNGVGLATYAFGSTFGGMAGKLLAVAVVMFAFSTVVGWSQFGAEAAVFLFGLRAEKPFKLLFTAFTVVGACAELNLVWDISDTLNGLMALPNLFTVLCLSSRVLAITRNYSDRVFGKKALKPMLTAYGDNVIPEGTPQGKDPGYVSQGRLLHRHNGNARARRLSR